MKLKALYLTFGIVTMLGSSTVFAQGMSPEEIKKLAQQAAAAEAIKKSQNEIQVQRLKLDPLAQKSVDKTVETSKKIQAKSQKRADGVGSTGGGTGCRGNFLSAAHTVAQWLEVNGAGMKPAPVVASEFESAIQPAENAIQLVPESEPLQYRRENVTAFFDGTRIRVRCDRLNKENPAGLKRVVAHEVFRKMGLEGDDYRYTMQVLGPAWAAANIAYSLDKKVTVIKFPQTGKSLVKISTKVGETEFFGIRECPDSALTATEGNVDISWEECAQVGGNYYKVQDAVALQEKLSHVVETVLSDNSTMNRAKSLFAMGFTFVSGGMIIYASDQSEVKGMKQIGQLIDRWIKFANPQITFRQMMITKWIVSVGAIITGTLFTIQSLSVKEQSIQKADEAFVKNDITLKTGSGYMPFGLSLILEFKESESSYVNFRDTIVDTMNQLEERHLIKSYGKLTP